MSVLNFQLRLGSLVFSGFVIALIASDSFAQESHKVYRCVVAERTVFADRPCAGADTSEEIDVTPTNTYHETARATVSTAQRASRPSSVDRRNESSIAEQQLKAKQQCQRLADQLAVIESKLRAGYTVKAGERLKERQRQLEARRRTEKCR